jgi:hypothetical protein
MSLSRIWDSEHQQELPRRADCVRRMLVPFGELATVRLSLINSNLTYRDI